jgi:hypothetical protein
MADEGEDEQPRYVEPEQDQDPPVALGPDGVGQ